MAPMPQWELPHTKVEQAQRTVGLLHKDFHVCVKNQEQIFSVVSSVCFDIPLLSKLDTKHQSKNIADAPPERDVGIFSNRTQDLLALFAKPFLGYDLAT
jgi:hypothetical protein